jgi:hypothetical protein
VFASCSSKSSGSQFDNVEKMTTDITICSSREKGNWEGTSCGLFNDALSVETI